MKTQNWIPEKNEVVTFMGQPHMLMHMNMGGKCILKSMVGRSRKLVKGVDLSEITKA